MNFSDVLTGMLYYRVKHALPEQMLQRLYATLSPNVIQEMGGSEFESAYALMVDVLTSHMIWTLDHLESTATGTKYM